jgi:hypothetical protein
MAAILFLLQIVLTSLTFINWLNSHSETINGLNSKATCLEEEYWIIRQNGLIFNTFGSQVLQDLLLSPSKGVGLDRKNVTICTVNRTRLNVFMLLLLGGDIAPNPGPAKDLCTQCAKNIRHNSKAIECDICLEWTHIACQSEITIKQYKQSDFIPFICNRCVLDQLPNEFEQDTPRDKSE